jgi:hypothetical protein
VNLHKNDLAADADGGTFGKLVNGPRHTVTIERVLRANRRSTNYDQ